MKKLTHKAAKKKAWDAFSIYIRTRDAMLTTGTTENVVCCTCGKVYPAFGSGCAQAGHFIPGRRMSNLFDERGCHAQCYNCNMRLKGNTLAYLDFMLEKYGAEVVAELREQNEKTVQYKPFQLIELCEKFKQKTLDIV